MKELFRVWNGSEMVYDITVGRFGVFYVNPENNGLDPNDSASLTPNTTKYPDDIKVMRNSGVESKSGKEVFEGDTVKAFMGGEVYGIGEVVFKSGIFWI